MYYYSQCNNNNNIFFIYKLHLKEYRNCFYLNVNLVCTTIFFPKKWKDFIHLFYFILNA